MRTSLLLGVAVLCLAGCGTGGDGGDGGRIPTPPSPESLFDGDYFFHMVGGDHEFGPWGLAGWGDGTADGVGTVSYELSANEGSTISGPFMSPMLPFTISSDRSVRWRPGVSSEMRGGVSTDGAVLGMGAHGSALRPSGWVLLRKGTGLAPADLTGAYHYAAFGHTVPALEGESRWGRASFDGTSAGSITWKANTEGSIPGAWVAEPFAYDVSDDGSLDLDMTGGGSFEGGMLTGGELAVVAGGRMPAEPPRLSVFIALSADATVAQLDGTYFVVGIELDRSTNFPATRTFTGTVRADGAGGIVTNLRMNEEGTVSGYSPIWSGYTVDADGVLEVTTPAGDLWFGGVAPSGRYAVFAGDTDLGGDPVLFFLFK